MMNHEWNGHEEKFDYLKDEIYKIMTKLYYGIVKVDLDSGYAVILSSNREDSQGKQYPWDEYLKAYVDKYLLPTDRVRAMSIFCIATMKENFARGKYSFSSDLSSYVTEKNEKHITMFAFKSNDKFENQYAYVLIRNAGGDYLLNSIVNQYVYDTCDYFIYLDAKNNSYTMFSGLAGTPLPPAVCMDYEKAIIEYAETFVVKEDREMVIRQMHLPRVIEQLEKNGIHSFTCGIMENERGYTRKRLDYRYHDRENQMILLSRTDITNIYFEEEHKRLELEKALARAQTDPLTKLLNFQATMDRITECVLDSEESYALYFIDLDNFKSINDTYGHPVGDSVLRNVAGQLAAIKGEGDIVGRVGGDEFVFFSKVLEDKESVERIAEKICYAIRSVKIDDKLEKYVTGSVGIALSPTDGRDYYALVTKADKGVYEAKKNGKNKFSV